MFLILNTILKLLNNKIFSQKKEKDKTKKFPIKQHVPEVPMVENHKCFPSESSITYPKGECIENMESELHSAAIDTEEYEQQSAQTTVIDAKCSTEDTNNIVSNLST